MAESYQGLTIRIGGDTTGLMSDLKAANGAISTTQRELRKLDQASKLDPNNLKVYTTQMGYMAQKASETAMRLQQLKAAAEQTANRQMKLGAGKHAGTMSVEGLANMTEDAALAAEMANARYNKLTDSLARMNTKVSELAMEAGKVELDSIAAEFANIPVGKGVDALIERFKALPETIRPGEKALETFKKKVQDLGEAFKGEKDKDKRAGFITEYKELVDKMVTANVPVFNFENGNIGADDIRTALEDIADIIGLDQTAIDEFIDRVKELKNAFKDAKSEVERTRIVKQFEDLKVEITKTEAVIASVNRAMAKLTVPSETSKRIHELNENVKFLESTFKSLQKSSSTLGDIVKADPGNVQAVTVAMHVLAESERNVEEEAKRIQEQIDSYDQASISAYTDSTKTAAQQLYDSAIAAEEAGNAYSDLNGKMSAWKHELDMLESSVEEETLDLKGMAEGDEEAAEAKDRLAEAAARNAKRIEELKDAIAESSPELQRLKAASQEASRSLEMSKARNEIETLNPRLVEVRARLESIKAAANDMAKTLTESVKTNGIKELFGDTTDIVKGFMSDFSASTGRADVFSKALGTMPANAELAEAKMSALTEAILSGQRAMAALEAASSQIDVSVVEEMKETYGTVENAIRQTTAATQDLTKRQLEARENLARMVSSSDYAGDDSDRVESLLLTKQEIEALPEEIRDAYDELSRLTAELDEAWSATAKAAQAGQWQEYQSGIVKTRTEIKGLRDDLKESASKKVDLEIDSEVSETFSNLIEQVDQYDAAIDKAINKGKELYAAFKQVGDEGLNDQSMRAFTEAATLAEDKAELIQDYINGIDSSRVDELRDKYGSLTIAASKTREEFSNTENKIAQLRQKIQEFANTAKDKSWVKSISDGNVEISKFPPEVQEAIEKLRELESVEIDQKLNAQIAAVVEKMDQLGLSADTAASKVMAAFDQTTKESGGTAKSTVDEAAFQQAFTRVSQYAQQAGRAVVESANTIDAAYRDMRKTVDGTEQQFSELRDAAIAFSQTHAVKADTILEIESYGGQLGVAVDHLKDFGNNVSNIAIATDITAEDMALQLGQMTNIMSDLDYTSFEGFADVLVRLGNNVAAPESAIMNIAQRMAAVANVTSMTTPQLMAWSAAIASTGQRSESAATAINNTIIGIGDAVAKGGKTLQQFANIAHMSVDEFKNAWENSSSDALEAFVKGLSELSDSNTDALQALDDVGISSIRQTTALLALSQTVGNVDSAMQMAEDAFVNGGDAAKEAAEKSKGFSGSLAILQSNAQNLAAALGDGMVPFMNLLSGTLTIVTNTLNMLPGPLKAVLVGVTGVTVAAGALSTTLHALKIDAVAKQMVELITSSDRAKVSFTGLGEAAKLMLSTFRDARSSGSSIAAAFTEATTAGEGATASFTALAGAANFMKTALAGIGIGLAVTAIMSLISAISKAIDEQNRLHEAEDRLTKATKALRDAANGATPEEKNLGDTIKEVGVTASETAKYINEIADAKERLANKFKGQNLELKVKTDLVDEALAKIEELSHKGSELSAVDQADLITSVKLLNDQLGTTLEVADPATMTIKNLGDGAQVSAGQISQMAKEALGLSEQETLLEQYADARKELAESEERLAEKTEAVNKLRKEGAEEFSNTVPSTREAVDANLQLVNANAKVSGSYEQAKKQLDAAQRDYDSYKQTVDEVANKLRESSSSQIRDLDETREAVYRLADGSKDLKSAMSDLGKTDMDLNTFADQFVYLGGTEEDFAKLTAAQLAEVVRAYNGTSASIATALASMNVSLSNAMRAAANATPQIVKPDDSAVREYKNQLEAAYTAAKRETEDYYNAEKKARDRYYDEQKRALDKAYNQRKKELDAEYDAAKKASDSYLKDFKKAQDEIVDAYKEATDARLKELEREYDAKKDMLDLEYQAYDDQISEKIQAIKDEQAAEDKALKMRERAEKLAELGKAVESAKNPKASEEANKALQDYKDQLTREDLKEQRNARIAAYEESRKDLKKQLSQRQEHLKETYDAAVEGYKAEREAKLKILQETNEAEYESQKALEEAKLNNIKASHEAELEMQKEANELYLQGIKDQHEAELLAIKRQNEDKLTELKNQQEAELAAYKKGGEAAVAALNGVKEETVELGDTVKNTSEEMQQVVTVSLGEIVRQLNEKGLASMQTYLGAMSQIPGGMSRIFEEAGIATGDGVKEVARLMYEQGEIGLSQYMAIMNNMPGATSAIANETGVALAARLGVFGEDVRIASQNLVDNAKYPMETLEPIAKANADKYAAQLAAVGSAENAEKVAKGSGNLFEAMRGPLANSDKAGEADGAKYPAGMLKGLNDTGQKAVDATVQLGDAVVKASDVKNAMSATGENDLIGWWNGFAANMPSILANVVSFFNNVVGVSQKAQGVHSPSTKFAWMAEMDLAGYSRGWERNEDGVLRMVRRTSEGLTAAFNPGSGGFAQDMLETMREREGDFRSQAERLARIVEDGFDPRLSLESAYQAMDRIDAATLKRQQTIAASSNTTNDNRSFNITISIPEVVVREEADIDRLSQQIALRVQRSINARIG